MKKSKFILSLLVIIMYSCTDVLNDTALVTKDQNNDIPKLKIRGDNEYDLLGFAFDATGPYLDQMKTAYPVIDVKKLHDSTNLIISDDPVHSELDVTSGSNAVTLLSKYNRKFSIEGKLPIGGLPFVGNLSSELNGSNTITTKYSYANADMNVYISHHAIKKYTDITILQQYLTQSFKDDLLTKTPAQIISLYGTHVYTDIYTGGKLSFNYRAFVNNNTKEQSVSYGAKVGVEAATNTNLSVSASTSYTTTATTDFQQAFFSYHAIGGTGASILGSWIPGTSTSPINFNQWSSTVSKSNEHSLQLIDVGDNSLMAIYEFVADPIKKAALKTAVNNYILGSTFTSIPVVPLYRYCHVNQSSHLYTTDLNEVSGNSNWIYEGIAAFVCSTQQPGTVPFYRFYKRIKKSGIIYYDHYYTRDYNSGIQYNYAYEGIECYVYPTPQLFTIGFRQYYNSSKYDHFYNTDPNEFNQTGAVGWDYNGDCCYVIEGTR